MTLKALLFLVPVGLGGWYVASGEEAASANGAGEVRAEAKAKAGPARKSLEECRELEQRLLEANAANPRAQNGFAAIRTLHAMAGELRRQGCDPGEANRVNGPSEPDELMAGGPERGRGRRGETSFEPGRPMVDVGHGDGR